jgi:glycerol-3-phosphate dehydrogenase (NAD(P)+)
MVRRSRVVTRVAVVGAGAWGTTLASLLTARAETTLWARESEVVASIRQERENVQFLPGFELPRELEVTGDLRAAITNADVVVFAVPTQHLRSLVSAIEVVAPLVLNVAKGLEQTTCMRMSEVLLEVMPRRDPRTIGVLSGPNLAREIMSGQPAATCVAFPDLASARLVQELLMTQALRVYTSDDVVGCEIGGALKNVIAIAAGVADGLGYGTNTKAALITRGLAELTRLGVAVGGRPLTFLGLSGNGDLIATCSSPQSRNYRLGQELAQGRLASDVLGGQATVAEGAATAPVAVQLAARLRVELPIAASVVALLQGDRTPQQLMPELMARDGKHELAGIDVPLAF